MFSLFANKMINKVCLLFITLLVTTSKGLFVNGECTWNLNTDLPQKTPSYTNNSGMIIPNSNGLHLLTDQVMTLVCVGKSNTIVGTGKQEIDVTCISENRLFYDGNIYNLSNFYCSSTQTTGIVLTSLPCETIGEFMNLGYDTSNGFITLINICYDRVKETNLFSRNILYGKALKAAQIDNNRPSFRTTGLTYGTATANCYKQTEQLIRFTQLLGSTQAKKYITSTSYLARGHIAPDGDFLFATWASTSYYLVNAAPQWQTVNAGNWLRVENTARDTAIKYQEDILSLTGIFGVLQLPKENGRLVDMYLMDPHLLRVPKWFWKILYSEETKRGIAFVTYNNPFDPPSEYICKDKCLEASWNVPQFTNYSKGYTYCCDVKELLNNVGFQMTFDIKGFITG